MREKLDHRVQIRHYICQKSKNLNKIPEINNLTVKVTLYKYIREKEEMKKSTEERRKPSTLRQRSKLIGSYAWFMSEIIKPVILKYT